MRTSKPKILLAYVAGPFSAAEPFQIEQNIRAAEAVGHKIVEGDVDHLAPLIPHANGRSFIGTKWANYWYDATLAMLERCDAVVLVPGWEKSRGTKKEIARAHKLGIPVFSRVSDLVRWAKGRT